MNEFFIFLLASLACFRVTRLITDDKITDWFRRLVVREAPEKLKKKAKEGINCAFCVSFWVSILICSYLGFSGIVEGAIGIVYLPAVWGASVMWNQLFMKLSK